MSRTVKDKMENAFVRPEALREELRRVESGIRFRAVLRGTIGFLLVVAAISVLLGAVFFPIMRIYGSSMNPTLSEGEIVASVKNASIRRGDLIAFYYGNKVLIKRCIAVSGEIVEIDDKGTVSVNGTPLEEPYVQERALGECDLSFPYQVPDGRYFVLGDQRLRSIDSRSSLIGCVATEQILGKVVLRLWPPAKFGAIR